MATAEDTCRAIVEAIDITRTGDDDAYITYSTILDIHLSNALNFPIVGQNTVLTALGKLLSDQENESLVEAIGWDMVLMLLPYIGQKGTKDDAVKVLDIVLAKGNAKEVFLKCNEGLKNIVWERTYYDDNDDGEATLAEKFNEVNIDDKDNKVDSVVQTVELYRAISKVFKRIRTKNPARFLTTFAAALLTNITLAYECLIDTEQLTTLHNLISEFITSTLNTKDQATDMEILSLLKGVITTYVPVYLSNQMLFWSGQYWETSHPISSQRIKSKDLVNADLENGLRLIYDLANKVGLTTTTLYEYIQNPPPDDVDLESSYPEGDGFIPIDPVGSLLLLATSYSTNPADLEKLLTDIPTKDCLEMHRRLVDSYLDEATFSVIDAIILLGMIIENRLAPTDLPSFANPQAPAPSEFLEYLQRMSASASTCASENLRPLIYTLVEQLLNKCSSEGRLYYILDTLDYCPYDNLKVAAVGTLKKQITKSEPNSVFSAMGILDEIGPRVFRLPEGILEDEEAAWDKVTFIIECLSLYRLLLLLQQDKIGVKKPEQISQTHAAWLLPLRKAMEKWIATIPQEKISEENEERVLMWRIIIENLDRIDDATRAITPY